MRQKERQEQGTASTRKGSQFIHCQVTGICNISTRSRSTVECGMQVECRVSGAYYICYSGVEHDEIRGLRWSVLNMMGAQSWEI